MDLSLEYRLKAGLTPYYYLEARDESVGPSSWRPRERDNMHRHRLGLRYERKDWSVSGEYEIFDDSILPYDAFHLLGRAALLRTGTHSLDVSAQLSRYRFDADFDDRRTWWFDMNMTDRITINRWVSAVTTAAYRWEDDSSDGTTNGVDVECGLRLSRGYLTVDLTAEFDLLSIAHNQDDGVGVFLNVRRDLTHLLPSRRPG